MFDLTPLLLTMEGESGVRAVLLDGVLVGSGEQSEDGGWQFSVGIPCGRKEERAYGYGSDMDAAWAHLLRDAAPHLARIPEHRRTLKGYHAQISNQANAEGADGAGWMSLPVDLQLSSSGVLRVPRGPFVRWALRRPNDHLWPAWDNVCPQDMKMRNDDPNHTDWMVGAGLDPALYYAFGSNQDSLQDLLNMAAYDAMYKVQNDMLNFTCAVLSGTGKCTGNAWHPAEHPGEMPKAGQVAVLPDASVRWLDVMVAAADVDMAIIVEVGGAGAHLVSLGRERDLRIVRVPHATTLYKDRWCLLTVDCDKGMVRIAPPE